jgi:hypothetical protein
MKVEQADRGKLISGWIKLSQMVVTADKNPNSNASQSEEQLTFEKAKQAILRKSGSRGTVGVDRMQRRDVINFKGVLTPVVCGTVDFKASSGSIAGPRRFVYFLSDQSIHYESSGSDPNELDAVIVKNFCS